MQDPELTVATAPKPDSNERAVTVAAAPPASLQRPTLSLFAYPITGPLFALIVIFVVFSLTTSTFMNAGNMSLIARQSVVIGDAFREETLRAAHLDTCLALVSVTSLDVVNLETALTARALRDDLRIVLRLTDDDLAERLEKTTGNMISRSVPYLAAPAFATAMLEHQVLRTIDVGRHVLLIAEIRVAEQAGLAGSLIRDTEQDGQARVLALQMIGAGALDWSPDRGRKLAAGDRLIVLATRRGLGRYLSVH